MARKMVLNCWTKGKMLSKLGVLNLYLGNLVGPRVFMDTANTVVEYSILACQKVVTHLLSQSSTSVNSTIMNLNSDFNKT